MFTLHGQPIAQATGEARPEIQFALANAEPGESLQCQVNENFNPGACPPAVCLPKLQSLKRYLGIGLRVVTGFRLLVVQNNLAFVLILVLFDLH